MKKPLVVLTGPTGVGKTELSILLAKSINGEIISADSMQIYQFMDIGTAKITKEEMQGVKHYLVDELLPNEEFHVAKFQKMAKEAIEEIYQKGKIPIIVGGTGFYIQAVLYDIDFAEESNRDGYRQQLEELARKEGISALHQKLEEIDPVSAKNIHENNIKRVIRAIEFYHETGKKISEHNEAERERPSPYNFEYFVLNDERERLYQRTDLRIDQMLENGLLEEVQNLKKMGYDTASVAMQGLGYKEILDYLDGQTTLEEAVYRLKRDTRHFVKRQLTWFRREKTVTFVNKADFSYNTEQILQFMIEKLKRKEIIE
ncbi:MAG: tRNA (adenosine(37)-N6)-dimethylallyltransferase MiaA [Lachnospiraceae bacterium]|nr:tRNA (adenosine(37)-N6)-dimethylallyltransferase MiaA [Lachnospiraceae bacterium]